MFQFSIVLLIRSFAWCENRINVFGLQLHSTSVPCKNHGPYKFSPISASDFSSPAVDLPILKHRHVLQTHSSKFVGGITGNERTCGAKGARMHSHIPASAAPHSQQSVSSHRICTVKRKTQTKQNRRMRSTIKPAGNRVYRGSRKQKREKRHYTGNPHQVGIH